MLIKFKNHTPEIGKNVLLCEGAKVIGEVFLDDDVSIWYNCVLRGDVNYIRIGKNTNIQDLSMVHVWHREAGNPDSGYPTIIGENVTIGHSCIIHACHIHDNCLIGMGSIIMDGAEIGRDSIVGAGAVVTKGKKFPPKSLILGNPAKFIRELKPEEIEEIANSATRYVAFKNEFLAN
ncbi:gamma carbonic anhydrase family protein [Helicobacter didelphidarum]|uniref:Gamma carbonic anhydrase family protein n=1 Tax=Helicobacter didelphidarum TaxID=2040648 RepID=A0A3D8IP17_9HELI|nr:gamma carbonic anhydrase family protein [Helicobacter didelphidarum]RDU67037.1 gamma carbonic anhydrase family protein [Helicobacter didelphidarum]